MPPAFDALSSGRSSSTSALTFNHTIGSGSNRMLLVFTISTVSQPTSVTYNGVAMTQVAGISVNQETCWYLPESGLPAAGTYQVAVNFSSAQETVAHGRSYSGSDQTLPGYATNSGNGTTASTSITVGSNNSMVVDGIGIANNNITMTPGGSQTNAVSLDMNVIQMSSSNKSVNAGSQSMSWTWTGALNWSHILIELNEPRVPDLMMAGVL